MIAFNDTMERLRSFIDKERNQKKILDRELASALSLDPQYFAVIKRRNKIPYEALAHYCHQHNLSLNWLLFAQEPQQLPKKGTQ